MATETWLWPKSMPATTPAEVASVTVVPRRPLPGSVDTRPAAARSRTMLDTVAGASPVWRARSACVTCPPMRSTSTTRCWLAERSDAVVPGEPVADMAKE